MVEWHHQFNGHEFKQTPGDSEGQGRLASYSSWGLKESEMTEYLTATTNQTFPGSSDSKGSAYNAGDLCSIPGSGRSPGDGNGNPLQYSCLENSMDRGAC